jgi:hypothetical protein
MMAEKWTSSNIFVSTVKKYLMKFDGIAFSRIDSELCRDQQKVKKPQLTLIDMWKTWSSLHILCNAMSI